jgi:very-short-patch-repair endonuclease
LKKSCHVYKDIWSVKNVTSDGVYIKPETIAISSNKKYFFVCHVCDHTYDQSPNNKSNRKNGCPFCSCRKICGTLDCLFCLPKSCDVYKNIWSDKNEEKPETVAISSNKKYLFDCRICNHTYEQTPGSKTQDDMGCPFCSNHRICGVLDCLFCSPKSCHVYEAMWSVKNISREGIYIKPETVAINSVKKYLFDCLECKNEYNQTPNDKTQGSGCPSCVNKTEKIVANYLKEMNINFIPQYKIGNVRKFYDLYLPDQDLIIEVDGEQHFKQVSNWKSPKDTLQNDLQKMKTALNEDISVLRIYQPDIWSDKIDWKKCINDNLFTRSTPTVVFSSSDSEIYNNHASLLRA